MWGSSLPYSEDDLEEIVAKGIQVVISLETSYALPDFSKVNINHHKFSFTDFGVPSDDLVTRVITVIHDALKDNKPVLVHCLAGCGRTGTILALIEIYLYGERDGDKAISKVREHRSCAIETKGQEEVIRRHASNPLASLIGFEVGNEK
ncbi:MAG: protein-tyrosine phosphatase family protein [Candidatus Thorarchaeota archaeon]